MQVYADKILDDLQSGTVDPSFEIITLYFKGSAGSILIEVKLDNQLYKSYAIDFDKCTIHNFD